MHLLLGRITCCLVLAALITGGGVGCTYRRVVNDGWGELRALADAPTAPGDPRDHRALSASNEGWAILVASFEGKKRQREARTLVNRLTRQANVPELWTMEVGGKLNVYRGRYLTPIDTRAQSDLRQTRLIQFAGDDKPAYEHAELVPLGPVAASRAGAYGIALNQQTGAATPTPGDGSIDLTQYAGLGLYTLQIGFYDSEFGPDYRDAAVKAAKALREESVEAYVYHGPNRSLVTVGVFTESDFVQDGQMQAYGPRMRELQEKFPNNLANGRTLVTKVGGEVTGNQPSFIVRVP